MSMGINFPEGYSNFLEKVNKESQIIRIKEVNNIELTYANTRKIRRKRAKNKMENEGLKHINKNPIVILPNGLRERSGSYFSKHWKEYGEI